MYIVLYCIIWHNRVFERKCEISLSFRGKGGPRFKREGKKIYMYGTRDGWLKRGAEYKVKATLSPFWLVLLSNAFSPFWLVLLTNTALWLVFQNSWPASTHLTKYLQVKKVGFRFYVCVNDVCVNDVCVNDVCVNDIFVNKFSVNDKPSCNLRDIGPIAQRPIATGHIDTRNNQS